MWKGKIIRDILFQHFHVIMTSTVDILTSIVFKNVEQAFNYAPKTYVTKCCQCKPFFFFCTFKKTFPVLFAECFPRRYICVIIPSCLQMVSFSNRRLFDLAASSVSGTGIKVIFEKNCPSHPDNKCMHRAVNFLPLISPCKTLRHTKPI